MPDGGPRYWAFLSYSHQDRRLAARLHRTLESYAPPRRLVGRASPAGPIPRRLRPIFRDRDELGAGADLGGRLRSALDGSAFLIVICSPAAAGSKWVDEELAYFLERHGHERVLAVIVAGRPFASDHSATADLECFPPSLRRPSLEDRAGRRREPAAADLRPRADGLRRAALKLVAGMLQVDLDELVRRDVQRRNRQLATLTAASCAATAVMAALALTAVTERNAAVKERNQAEGLIEFMIGDLRNQLEQTGGLQMLDEIGAHALEYYRAQNTGDLDATALGRRARVLQVLGEVREERGDLPAAERFFEESSKSTAALLQRAPKDAQRVFDQAQSEFYLGDVAMTRGDYGDALAHLERYRALATRLVALQPGKLSWWAEVEDADEGVAAALLREGRIDQSVAENETALAISRRLALVEPLSRDRQWDLAQIYAWTADAELARGRVGPALSDRQQAAVIYRGLIQRNPADKAASVALAFNQAFIARVRMRAGALGASITDLRAAAAEMDHLLSGSPDDVLFMTYAEPIYVLLGEALLRAGQAQDALSVSQRAVAISEAALKARFAHGGAGARWKGDRLGAARAVAIRAAAASARTLPAQKAALAPAPAEAERLQTLLRADPNNTALALAAARTSLLAGDFASVSGDTRRARSFWSAAAADMQAKSTQLAGGELTPPLMRQLELRLSRPPARAGATRIDYRW